MRLTLVLATLAGGGAERTASVLAGAWAGRGHQVTIITLAKDDVPAYTLHSAITYRQLRVWGRPAQNIFYGLFRQLKAIRALRRVLQQSNPDFIISFMDVPNVVTLFAGRGLNVPIIVTEHVHPAFHRIGRIWDFLRRFSYPRGILVGVSKPIIEWFQCRINVNARVIPNPVDLPVLPASHRAPQDDEKPHVIIGMGRLVPQKGFDLLLQAFSRIASRHHGWRLKIIGDGPLRKTLQEQSENLGIADRVEFTGLLADPFPVLRAADLFVFSSRFEGFGNALCEAMACGLPVISFDCPSGPSEVVRHGVDGILVPAEDVNALSAAMDRLMSDAQTRIRLAARATEIVARYGVEPVMGIWDQLFAEILVKGSRPAAEAQRR
jgi:glycosyltransferase involved in cell wall biosynthesis